jgi:hypothetical protein
MDIIDLVNSIITDLDKLSVSGAANMAIVLASIQKLDLIKQSLAGAKEKAEAANVQNTAE